MDLEAERAAYEAFLEVERELHGVLPPAVTTPGVQVSPTVPPGQIEHVSELITRARDLWDRYIEIARMG